MSYSAYSAYLPGRTESNFIVIPGDFVAGCAGSRSMDSEYWTYTEVKSGQAKVEVFPWKKIGRTRVEGERTAPATMVDGPRRRRFFILAGP